MSAIAAIVSRVTPWARLVELAALIAFGVGCGTLGWHERAIRADRDSAVTAAADAETKASGALQLAGAQGDALKAATNYAERAAALRPQYQVIHDKASPILVTLASCPLPADALGVLDAAAEWADRADGAGGPGAGAHGTAAAPGARSPDGR
jgi:hypothetical protein